MKRITAIALFIIAAFITTGRAVAQDRAVRATVPFDFTVGDKLLPSGTYTITSASADIIVIKNYDRRIAILSTATPDSKESRNGSKLVFDKYGDQYFLHEILCQSAALNVNLPTSKQEKKARVQEAMLHSAGQVFVAAR
ncbi:MAG TPA: hypothetical protein VHT28_00650 [Silvibacterium sp.]|jgi:hypothetical protein|nr:hypothetical protein [Silvibacterium sp.]